MNKYRACKGLAAIGAAMVFAFSGAAATGAVISQYGDADGLGIGVTSGDQFDWFDVGFTPDAGTITDAWIYNTQTWTMTFSAGLPLTSATLQLFVGGIGAGGPGSVRVLIDGIDIGTLTVGDGPYLETEPLQTAWLDTFNLNPYLATLADGSLTIQVQTSRDGWALDYSRLTMSVPEPASVTLLAFGLIGLAATRRREQ